MIVWNHQVEGMVKKIEQAGANILTYVLVAHPRTIFMDVISVVPIVLRDDCPKDTAYLMERDRL